MTYFARRLACMTLLLALLAAPAARRRTAGTDSAAKLEGTQTLRLKLRGRLNPGSYSLRLAATDAQGRAVPKTVKVRVGRWVGVGR